LGEQLRATGRLADAQPFDERAIEHWRAAIRVEPYIAGARSELATMLEQRGADAAEVRRLREEEVALLKRDAELTPSNGQVFYRLGMMYVLLGNLDLATDALLETCRLSPNDYTSRMALALVYQERYDQSGDEEFFNSAARELAALHQLQPSDPRARSILRNLMQVRQMKQNAGPPRVPQ
jgi:cytochrome c-type biogenesis protein CcmH/NrfG